MKRTKAGRTPKPPVEMDPIVSICLRRSQGRALLELINQELTSLYRRRDELNAERDRLRSDLDTHELLEYSLMEGDFE